MKLQVLFLLSIVLVTVRVVNAGANKFNKEEYYFKVYKTSEKINVDGKLDEETWSKANVISGFYQHYPKDDVPADANTEVRIGYDDKYLFIGATCFEENSSPLIQTLKRDDFSKLAVSDAFFLIIDAINNNKNAYLFGLNAEGSQVDGIVSQIGGQPQLDANWDNVWYSEVSHSDKAYTCEMAIPFSSMKFKPENRVWGINFSRNDMKRSIYYVWTKFPVNFDGGDLNYNGEIEFADGVPQQTEGRFEFFPAISGNTIKDFENDAPPEYNLRGGMDAKMGIGSSFNLNLSVFPDFSTVQVDQQYIDFYRYEYFAQEQRLFFLENNDLFINYGTVDNFLTPAYAYKIKPFYSRRIAIKDWQYFDMYYGARLSGNVTDKLRIGLMNVQTDAYEDLPKENYSVATVQQSLFKNSSVRGLFLNRQSIGNAKIQENENNQCSDFNRNGGVEFDYITPDNKWSVLTKYHRSFSPENYSNSNFYSSSVIYNSDKLRMQNLVNHVDDNYISDAGYIPRLYQKDAIRDTTIRMGYTQFMNNTIYQLPNGKRTSFQAPYFNVAFYLQPGKTINEIQQEAGYYMQFNNRAFIFSGFQYNYLDLLFPFDVLKNDKPLPAQRYEYINLNFSLGSDPRKKLNYSFYGDYGTFYNGKKLFLEFKTEYRIQPWGTFQLTYNICDLQFPDEYGSATHHLITGKTEIGLSRSLIWTTLMQYNTQESNINVNSMLQWRFRPLSDFYIVVKDDMKTGNFDQKKLQVVFKFIYWFRV